MHISPKHQQCSFWVISGRETHGRSRRFTSGSHLGLLQAFVNTFRDLSFAPIAELLHTIGLPSPPSAGALCPPPRERLICTTSSSAAAPSSTAPARRPSPATSRSKAA